MRIGFIGVGHMGGPMAINLVKAGHEVMVYDLASDLCLKVVEQGAKAAASVKAAVTSAQIVITMLPEGRHVTSVYEGTDGIFENAPRDALLIDCSTIDVATSQQLHAHAKTRGYSMLDAPVSGGTAGAAAGTLTFMVGGEASAFEQAKPILAAMGKKQFHAGTGGSGQAAKICNNMLLGISMIGVCEAFQLAEKLGLSAEKFFEICAVSTGQCWSLTSYCPVPGPVSTSPANRDYNPGFTAKMMLKDLHLSQQAAEFAKANTPLGTHATELYEALCQQAGDKDFSYIMQWLKQQLIE